MKDKGALVLIGLLGLLGIGAFFYFRSHGEPTGISGPRQLVPVGPPVFHNTEERFIEYNADGMPVHITIRRSLERG